MLTNCVDVYAYSIMMEIFIPGKAFADGKSCVALSWRPNTRQLEMGLRGQLESSASTQDI